MNNQTQNTIENDFSDIQETPTPDTIAGPIKQNHVYTVEETKKALKASEKACRDRAKELGDISKSLKALRSGHFVLFVLLAKQDQTKAGKEKIGKLVKDSKAWGDLKKDSIKQIQSAINNDKLHKIVKDCKNPNEVVSKMKASGINPNYNSVRNKLIKTKKTQITVSKALQDSNLSKEQKVFVLALEGILSETTSNAAWINDGINSICGGDKNTTKLIQHSVIIQLVLYNTEQDSENKETLETK